MFLIVLYEGGDIPVTATLGSKIYPVLCDNQESTLIFLQHLHQRMVAESLEFQSTLRKLFISYLEDIRIVLQVLKKGKELNCNRIWNYSLSARTGVLIAKHELDIDDDMKTFAIHEVAMTGMYKQVKA